MKETEACQIHNTTERQTKIQEGKNTLTKHENLLVETNVFFPILCT